MMLFKKKESTDISLEDPTDMNKNLEASFNDPDASIEPGKDPFEEMNETIKSLQKQIKETAKAVKDVDKEIAKVVKKRKHANI